MCYILQKRSKSSKFAPKTYEGFLLGYDSNSRAYRIFLLALGTFLLKMVLGLVRPTLLPSQEKWLKICLYAKSMLMILYLVLLTNPFVMSLAK
jgi:hypothetical protein